MKIGGSCKLLRGKVFCHQNWKKRLPLKLVPGSATKQYPLTPAISAGFFLVKTSLAVVGGKKRLALYGNLTRVIVEVGERHALLPLRTGRLGSMSVIGIFRQSGQFAATGNRPAFLRDEPFVIFPKG
jgi:hypothetical protein